MTPLRYVVFGQPIPVADTHRREPRFEADDGWSITRDADSETWRIVGHGVDFETDGINSWAPTPPKEEPHPYASAFEIVSAPGDMCGGAKKIGRKKCPGCRACS